MRDIQAVKEQWSSYQTGELVGKRFVRRGSGATPVSAPACSRALTGRFTMSKSERSATDTRRSFRLEWWSGNRGMFREFFAAGGFGEEVR